MTARPVRAMNEAVARQIINETQGSPERIAVLLADELITRKRWKANTCAPLLRAYEIAIEESSSMTVFATSMTPALCPHGSAEPHSVEPSNPAADWCDGPS